MPQDFALVAGHRVRWLSLFSPWQGAWYVETELQERQTLTGRVEVTLGSRVLSCTIQPGATGGFAMGTKARLIAGAGGWGTPCTPRPYHADPGVNARTVAEDAARIAGENLVEFFPAAAQMQEHYSRRIVEASRVLEDAAGGVPWWLDDAGGTHVAERPAVPVGDDVELLDFDPHARMATLGLRDPADVSIGSVLSGDDRLDGPQTIRELEISIAENELRAYAWTSETNPAGSRVGSLLRAMVRRELARRLLGGPYRYRVFEMASDGRVKLQAVRRAPGLPDVIPCEQWPGVPGMDVELSKSMEVLVQFIEGDPGQPVMTGYKTSGSPVSVAFDHGDRPVARVGDGVKCFVAPGVPIPVTGTVSGAPFAGTMTIATALNGVITTGNPKVLG